MMSRRCKPEIFTSWVAQSWMLLHVVLAIQELSELIFLIWTQAMKNGNSCFSQLWTFGFHVPFPFCLITPYTTGFNNCSYNWICNWKRLYINQDWSNNPREHSQLASDNNIAVQYYNLLTLEWAHGTDWDPGRMARSWDGQAECLCTSWFKRD